MLSLVVIALSLNAAIVSATDGTVACDPALRPAILSPGSSFSSPGFNEGTDYPADSQCEYLLPAANGAYSVVSFDSFTLEECSGDDVVEVYDGTDDTGALIASYCGGPAAPFSATAASGNIFIRFTSGAAIQAAGFEGTAYNSGEDPCGLGSLGLYLTDTTGTFTSPNFPNPYNNNANCNWYIVVPDPSFRVRWNMQTCNIEDSCGSWDQLEVFERDTGEMMVRWYGDCPSGSSVNFDNRGASGVRVHFDSDSSVVDLGFDLSYEIVPAS